MNMNEQEIQIIEKKIDALSQVKAIIFSLHLVKRLIPNYAYFAQYSNWGNVHLLNDIIFLLQNNIRNSDLKLDFLLLQKKLLEVSPDSEQFPNIYSTYALDCCAALSDLLFYVQNNDLDFVKSISSLSFNTMYISIVDTYYKMGKEDVEDSEIYSNDLIKKELLFQKQLLQNIIEEKNITLLIENLKLANYASNIGL